MIAIIDYGAGNIQSVKNALDKIGAESVITSDAETIKKADKVIFPGVGNFGDVMKALSDKCLIEVIKEAAVSKPFLGICVGLQVLFEESEESPGVKGLGLFKGKVRKFDSKTLKIPQIGWNSIKIIKENKILKNVKNGSYFYFVHSYYVDPSDDEIVICKTEYGIEFVSGIGSGNLVAVQFHPERSGELGLKVLEEFC